MLWLVLEPQTNQIRWRPPALDKHWCHNAFWHTIEVHHNTHHICIKHITDTLTRAAHPLGAELQALVRAGAPIALLTESRARLALHVAAQLVRAAPTPSSGHRDHGSRLWWRRKQGYSAVVLKIRVSSPLTGIANWEQSGCENLTELVEPCSTAMSAMQIP